MEYEHMLERAEGFDWDKGNINKNWIKHRVSDAEVEEVFFNDPLIFQDTRNSQEERRYYCLGETNTARFLFIVFTRRNNKVRVISPRDMGKKERRIYAKEI